MTEASGERTTRRILIGGAILLAGAGASALLWRAARFPSEERPEGAYARIAWNLSRGDLRAVFAYLDDETQHACLRVGQLRREASSLVDGTFPEPERTRLLDEYRAHASAKGAPDVWIDLAHRRGYEDRLRRDVSGVSKVEVDGDQATVETAHGTRYPFRKRSDATWGLALFSDDLASDAERAARDLEIVKASAADYERVGK